MTILYCMVSFAFGAGLVWMLIALLSVGTRCDNWQDTWGAGYRAGLEDGGDQWKLTPTIYSDVGEPVPEVFSRN